MQAIDQQTMKSSPILIDRWMMLDESKESAVTRFTERANGPFVKASTRSIFEGCHARRIPLEGSARAPRTLR